MAASPLPGGFLSPPPSSLASTASAAASALPHPRNSPLRPGGTKESTFIRYVDQQILHIQRRFAKRTSPQPVTVAQLQHEGVQAVPSAGDPVADTWNDVKGYSTQKQACKDIETLVDVVWISGTPSLQVPYLISISLLLSQVIAGMQPSPRPLFRCLGKLDRCFASLLQGRDVETGEPLPGFMGMKGVSGTEKVRIRSLVERTRIGVMEVFRLGEFEDFEEPEEENAQVSEVMEDEDEMDHEGELILEGDDLQDVDEEDDSFDMLIARVYDRTMQELGDSLEAPTLGIITESRG